MSACTFMRFSGLLGLLYDLAVCKNWYLDNPIGDSPWPFSGINQRSSKPALWRLSRIFGAAYRSLQSLLDLSYSKQWMLFGRAICVCILA